MYREWSVRVGRWQFWVAYSKDWEWGLEGSCRSRVINLGLITLGVWWEEE